MAVAGQRGGAVDQEEKEKEKMQGKQEQAFTIRGFVAAMREKDITKCWPFTPTQLQASMKESSGVQYYAYGNPGAVSHGDSASIISQESRVEERLRAAQQSLLPPFYPPVSDNKKLDLNDSFFTSGSLSSCNHISKNPCNDEYRDNVDDDRSLQFSHGSIQVQIELLSKASSTDYYHNDHHQRNHTITACRSRSDQTATCLPKKIKSKTVLNMGCKDNHQERISRSNMSHHHHGESFQSCPAITSPSSFHNMIMNPGPTLQSHQSIREIRQSIIDQGCRCCSEEPDMVTAVSTTTIRGPWYGHDNAAIDGADPHNINVIHSSPQTSQALSMLMMTTDSCGSINGVHHESCLIRDGGIILPTDQSTIAVKGNKAFVNMPSSMGQMVEPMFSSMVNHSSPLTCRASVNSNEVIPDGHRPSSDQYHGINHNACSKLLRTDDHQRLITSHASADNVVNDCINKDSVPASSLLKLALISSPATPRASVLDSQEQNAGYVHINLCESHVSASEDNINCDIKSNDSDADEDGKKVCADQGSAHDGIMNSAKAANSKLQKLGYDQSVICKEFGSRAVGITTDRQDGNANSKSSVEVSVYDPHIEEPMTSPSNNADSNSALTNCGKSDLQVCNNAAKSSTPLSVVHVNNPTSTASRPVAHNEQVLVTTNNSNTVSNSTFAIQKCPICLHFQASSNTALNAHIDHCLASSSTNQSKSSNDQIVDVNHVQVDLVDHRIKPSSLKDRNKSSTLASKTIGKPRKIKSRSIAELCAINDHPVPGAASASRISLGTITYSSNHTNRNFQHREHDGSAGSNHDNSNHEFQMDGYHDEDPVMMCQKSAMQLGDGKVFDGTMASQSLNFCRGKRSKVGTGRITTRSSSTFDHDDSDGNDDQIMRGHQSRPHEVLKPTKQPQKQPKQNLTESSSSSTKTTKTNSPAALITALPSMECTPQDQSKSRHVTESINPSGTSGLQQQHRSKNITNIINNPDRDGRRRSCRSNVSAGSSKDKTGNAELVAEVQNRLPASRNVTGMKLRSKSCKKTMTRKFGQLDPNESETANGSDCPVQGSYGQMPLQVIRSDVLSTADIRTPKPSSDNTDNVNSMPNGKINAGAMQPELDDGAYICSNQKDANQSLSIEQEIVADQQSFAPVVSIVNKTVAEGQDEVIDIPESGLVLDPQASEAISHKVVVQPDNLQALDHGSEASECSRSVNQAALPGNSSTNVGSGADEAAQRHISSHDYQMSNICSSTNFTGCNSSLLDDPAALAPDSDQGSQLPPINVEELHPSYCDQTTSNGQINNDNDPSNSDQFISHALPGHGVLRSSITTASEQPQGIPESTNFLSASGTHIPDINHGFQYVATSNYQQAVGNINQNNGIPIYDLEDQAVKSINQKNSVPIYDQEDQFRALVVVNVIQPVQANGMTNISTASSSRGYLQGPARADLIMTPAVRHSQHPNFNHGTHFPNQRSSGSVLPISSIPVYSQLQSGGQPITKSTLSQKAKSGFSGSLPPWMEAAIKIDSTSAAAAAFPPGNMSAHNCSTYASDMRSQHPTEQYSDASRVFQAVNGKPINLRLMGKTMVLTPASGSNGHNPVQIDSTSCAGNRYDSQGSTQKITAGPKVPYNTDQLRAQIINTKPQQETGNSLQLAGSVGMRTLVSSSAHDSRASVLQSWSTNPAVRLPPACHTFDQTTGQRTRLGSSSSIGLQDNVAAQYASKVIRPCLQPSDSSFQTNAGSGYMLNTGHDNGDGHDEVSAYLYPIYPSHEYMMHPAASTRTKSSSMDTTRIDDAYLCLQQQMLKDRNSSVYHVYPSPAPPPHSYYNQYSEACRAVPQPEAVSYNIAQQYIGHDIQRPHQLGAASIDKPSSNASVETQGSAIWNNIPHITVNNNHGVDGHITTNCDSYIPPCWKPNADKKQNKPHPQRRVEEIIIDEAEHVTNTNRSVPRLFGQDLNPMGVTDRHQSITHASAHPGQISQTLMQPGRSIPINSSMNQVQISTCGALEPQWSTIMRAPRQQEQVSAAPAVQYFVRPGAAHDINYGTVVNPKKRAANYQGGYTLGISNYGGSLGSRKRSRTMKRNQQVLLLPDSRVNAAGAATDSTSYEQFVVVQRRPFTNDLSTGPCSYITVKQKSKSRNTINSSPNSARPNRDMISALGTGPCLLADSQATNMNLCAQPSLYTSFNGTMPTHKVLPVQLTSELAANPGLEGSFVEKCSVNMNPAEVVDFHDASQCHVYPAR